MLAALLIIIIVDYFLIFTILTNDDWQAMKFEETWRQELLEQNI